MKRLVLGIFTFCCLVTGSNALADGYVPEASDNSTVGEDAAKAADRAKQMDQAAETVRDVRMEQVAPEKLSAAVGHYSRARSLMIAALREFDQGYKIARPDSILNTKEWRDDLISRTEDLDRVLAPQARASKYGVRYDADPRLLNTEAK